MSSMPDLSYTRVYESVRSMGIMLAPAKLKWETEVRRDFPSSEYLIHLSCLAHFTPHVAYLAQSILAQIGINAPILGGPEACCGTLAHHMGDHENFEQGAKMGLGAIKRSRTRTLLSVCPDCDESFNRFMPENASFRSRNVVELLTDHRETLVRAFKPLSRRVLLHSHRSNASRTNDMDKIITMLSMIPGLTIAEAPSATVADVPHCSLPFAMQPDRQQAMVQDGIQAGFDTLVVPYHSCYRQHCGLEFRNNIRVCHYLELIADSLSIPYEEPYKAVKQLPSWSKIVEFFAERSARLNWSIEDLERMIEYSFFPYATDKKHLEELRMHR
jgi:Cysteine-rich domain